MGKPLSNDLRERVVGAVVSGLSRRRAASRFGVSASSAIRWVAAWRATDRTPDITIEELRAVLAEQDVIASHGAVWNLLARHGLTVKKTAHASEQERADVAAAREAWREMQQGLDPFRLVFLDESGVKTNMARRCGRAKKGERLVASIPMDTGNP